MVQSTLLLPPRPRREWGADELGGALEWSPGEGQSEWVDVGRDRLRVEQQQCPRQMVVFLGSIARFLCPFSIWRCLYDNILL